MAHTFKSLLRSVGLTQQGLADLLGVREATVSDWATGKAMPRADMLVAIERVTGGKLALSEVASVLSRELGGRAAK